MQKLFFFGLVLIFLGCSSQPPRPTMESAPPPPPSTRKSSPSQPTPPLEIESVDLNGLRRTLGLNIDRNTLGYFERPFDTCQVGQGFSKTKNCSRQMFVLIQLRLQCRDTEGTTSEIVTQANLTPIAQNRLSWSVKSAKGEVFTDSQGYGQIQMVVPVSQKGQRIRIGNQTDFLYLKADEVSHVITPRYWCR